METAVIIGILAGVLVFLLSTASVFILLFAGGSVKRLRAEQEGLPPHRDALKPLLYSHLLEKSKTLPVKPSFEEVSGNFVRLREFCEEQHAESLFSLAQGSDLDGNKFDPELEFFRFSPVSRPETRAKLVQRLLGDSDNSKILVVEDEKSPQRVLGLIKLVDNSPSNLRIAIGMFVFPPSVRGSPVPVEAMLLLLRSLFNKDYRRIEWKVDAFDARARKAAKKLGFILEGVLRKAGIVQDCNQDLAVFSVVNSEWENTRIYLKTILESKSPKFMRQSMDGDSSKKLSGEATKGKDE